MIGIVRCKYRDFNLIVNIQYHPNAGFQDKSIASALSFFMRIPRKLNTTLDSQKVIIEKVLSREISKIEF